VVDRLTVIERDDREWTLSASRLNTPSVTYPPVIDGPEIRGIERVKVVPSSQLQGAVEAERLLAAALEDDHLDPLDIGRAARRALDALEDDHLDPLDIGRAARRALDALRGRTS
jgi:hypothetical protein